MNGVEMGVGWCVLAQQIDGAASLEGMALRGCQLRFVAFVVCTCDL